ncbi:MAG TPA: hypothetical protein DCQ50_14675 [Chryseobacterium sp.]|nr:hypothetical protein [Chryseobacterium sp.]
MTFLMKKRYLRKTVKNYRIFTTVNYQKVLMKVLNREYRQTIRNWLYHLKKISPSFQHLKKHLLKSL